jgi:nitroimidazol reductase NimA-like FMN-containing flavoprotein (pyridoxamine 5'-phosphate oxidase superfamily)
MDDPVATAKAIVDATRYMVLGTADAAGVPWASPVYFAHVGYRDFLWASKPGARHSLNIAARPEVGIVVFDSSVPPGQGQGVYLSAVAHQLAGDDIEAGLAAFSERLIEDGGAAWSTDRVDASARHRLYRATAVEHFILDEQDERIPFVP